MINVDAVLVGLGITVLVNFGGLIWGAAKISETVSTLKDAVTDLRAAVAELRGLVAGLSERVTVLEVKEARR